MITETALRIAGRGSVLVARPTGVAHVYTGPLTPSGRFVPRSRRTVCRAHTRRLTVLPRVEGPSSLDRCGAGRVLCARCSACLSTAADRQAAHPQLRTRDEYRLRYAALEPFDLALAAEFAETPAEVDQVAHLSLVLFGLVDCDKTAVTRPDGQQLQPLNQHIAAHRRRVGGIEPSDIDDQFATLHAAAIGRRKADRAELRDQRDERIHRLGFNNATR